MQDSPELPIEHDRSSDELAELINQFATTFEKELPLKVLYRWKDPTYLSKEMREKYPVPEEWIKFNQLLTINERIKITKAIGFAARSELNTVGDLQEMEEEELSQCELPGTKFTIGPDAAHILFKGFAIPKEQQDELKG